MAFVSMSPGAQKPYSKWDIGDYLVGTIINRTPGKYGSMNIVIRVEENGMKSDGPTVGSNFSLYPCTASKVLDEQDKLPTGTRIKVIYEGERITKTGKFAGKPFNKVEFFIDMPEADPTPEAQEPNELGGL